MRMPVKTIFIATVTAFVLTACEDSGTKQQLGTLLGGVAGAVAGAQVGKGRGQLAATAAGTLLGAWLGSEVGKSLDRADRLAMEQTTQRALEEAPVGKARTWRNPDSGHHGTVTPTSTTKAADGRYCREFRQTVNIGDRQEEAYGTACRKPDGSWEIVSS